MKNLYTIIKSKLQEGENIWINKQSKIDDLNDSEWWKFEEFTFDQIFNNFSGKEKVVRYWHEDGLCIILNI